MTRPDPTNHQAAHKAAYDFKGAQVTEYLAGIATALLVLAILNRRTVRWHIKEEYRYRRDGIYVWWVLRQERKTAAKEAS